MNQNSLNKKKLVSRQQRIFSGGLPKQALEEFKQLYLLRYGVNLVDAKAQTIASKLLRLVKTVQSGEIPHD